MRQPKMIHAEITPLIVEPNNSLTFNWLNMYREKSAKGLRVVKSMCSVVSICFTPLIILKNIVTLVNDISYIMRLSDLARSVEETARPKLDNPLVIILRKRYLFDVKDKFFHTLSRNPNSTENTPNTLVLIAKAFYHLYGFDFTLLLNDREGYREICIPDLLDSSKIPCQFCVKAHDMPRSLYHYLYVPYVTTLSKVLCHYMDVYESDLLFSPKNYQVLVWANNESKFISDADYYSLLNDISRNAEVVFY